MTIYAQSVFFGVSFLLSASLVGLFRIYSLRVEMLDYPNERSSHTMPTPRGGGLVIILVFLLGLAVLSSLDFLPTAHLWVLGGAVPVALIGFADDRKHIPARWRVLVHLAAAGWGIYWLQPMPALFGEPMRTVWEVIAPVVGGLAFLWLINLYNFMDGIDGIASIEAMTTAIPMGVILWLTGTEATAMCCFLLAAATAGFLLWNWPPAKIFMGDVGSGTIGYIIAALAILSGQAAPEWTWAWVILLGVFVVDATITLLRRAARGERWYAAHHLHAYQHAARRWGHRAVTISVFVINVFWLTPCATLMVFWPTYAGWWVLLALTPLVIGCVRLGGGTAIKSTGNPNEPVDSVVVGEN